MRKLALWLGLCALLGGWPAVAMPAFRKQAIQQFRYDQGNPLWEYDRRVMACTYCHVKEAGGPPWNSFGQALQSQFQADASAAGRNKFPQVLYDLLKAAKDSDGDGYTDALEVFAKTLPGDPASRPKGTVAELTKAFEAAGGVGRFQPLKRGNK